jgi:carbon-monoxide dehydrogenase medium subunit
LEEVEIVALFYRKLPRFAYLSPRTIDEALALLARYGGEARLLAGGTDLVPQLKRREIDAPAFVIDLKGIPGIDGLSYDAARSCLSIGALTTIAEIGRSEIVRRGFPALFQAAAAMACPQVRNRGTFAGNICNAVPSADSAPGLLALGASLFIRAASGERVVPLDQFFTGPRATVMRPEEMLVEISVPRTSAASGSVYLKLAPRHSMDLAVVGVAAAAHLEDGVCRDVRIALGAVAPTPLRARSAEDLLLGKALTAGIIEEAAGAAATACMPIDDHRASAEYRCDMVYVMTRRALNHVLAG